MLKFKTANEKTEWPDIAPELRVEALLMAQDFEMRFGLDCYVTEALRTKAEQAQYYPNDPDRWTDHFDGTAIDIRSRELSKAQIEIILALVRARSPEIRIIHHDMGKGSHFHLELQ